MMDQQLNTPFVKLADAAAQPAVSRLAVRTNLRAGLAWDDLDDQAQALWNKLTGAVSNATSALTGSSTDSASGSTPV